MNWSPSRQVICFATIKKKFSDTVPIEIETSRHWDYLQKIEVNNTKVYLYKKFFGNSLDLNKNMWLYSNSKRSSRKKISFPYKPFEEHYSTVQSHAFRGLLFVQTDFYTTLAAIYSIQKNKQINTRHTINCELFYINKDFISIVKASTKSELSINATSSFVACQTS